MVDHVKRTGNFAYIELHMVVIRRAAQASQIDLNREMNKKY